MPNPDNIKKHEFKKGESGNPKGRPKGSKNRSTTAKKWLEISTFAKNPITGETEELTLEDQMTLALIQLAKEGKRESVSAYEKLMDSAFGKPSQQIDHSVEQGIFKKIDIDIE